MTAGLFSVIYNTVLTVTLTMAACCVYFLYCSYKRPVLIALLVMFAAYLVDNTIVFCTEVIPEFAAVYDEMFLETPSVKTIYFIVLIGSLLFGLHQAMPAFTLRQMALLIFIYAALLICVPMISQNDWMVFAYYFITQFLVIGISGWGLVALRSTQSSFSRGLVRRVFQYFLCMSILVLAEDSFVIFFLDRFSGPRMKINNRNYCENLLYLGLAWPVFRYTVSQLKQVTVRSEDCSAEDISEPDRDREVFQEFTAAYSLTERECEILHHLLQAKSQQEISEELIIALGTVKTHIHNIYQKTNTGNRKQIIAAYQEFCSSRTEDSAS